MAGKIQKQDVKTLAELTGAGATAADLINTDQIYDVTNAQQLSTSISGGDLMSNPMTTNGDLITQAAGVPARIAVGANGEVLTVVGGAPAWAASGGGGGGSGSTYTLGGILTEILSDEADTFIPIANQIVDDFNDEAKGTKTNCSQSLSALRFSGSNLTANYERIKLVTKTMGSVDGGAIVSAQALAPKNTAASPSSTAANVTFIFSGDVTNMFADTKKVILAKKATADGKTVYVGLLNASAKIAELAINGAPSYASGPDETTLVIANPGTLDLDFDLASSAYNDQLRIIPWDYQFQVKSASASAYETMAIDDLVALDTVRVPGESNFAEIFSITGSIRKQDMAVCPSKQYQIVRLAEHVGTASWVYHFGYSVNYGASWTKFATTVTTNYVTAEEASGGFDLYNPQQLAVADNGKAVWVYTTYSASTTASCTDGKYSDLTAGTPVLTAFAATGNDAANGEGATAGRIFSVAASEFPCVGIAADLADLSLVAVMGIKTTSVGYIRWFTAGGATHSGLSSASFTASDSYQHILKMTGTSGSHRTHAFVHETGTLNIYHKYWDEGSFVIVGSVQVTNYGEYMRSCCLSNNRAVIMTENATNTYIHTGTTNGTPSWSSLGGVTVLGNLKPDRFVGWSSSGFAPPYKVLALNSLQNPSDEKHVAIVADVAHPDAISRSTLIEIVDVSTANLNGVSQLSSNGNAGLNDGAGTQKRGTVFTATAATPRLRTFGNLAHQIGVIPSGSTIVADLYATAAGVPTGASLGTSVNSIDATRITKNSSSQWIHFNFNNISLTNGTVYAVVLTPSYATSGSNYINLRYSSLDPYAGGDTVLYNGTTWSAAAGSDLAFYVSDAYITEIGKGIQSGANRASYGFHDQESQIAKIDTTTAQITFRRTIDTDALRPMSGHPWRRILTWGSGGTQSALSSAVVAGYATTNYDENLVLAASMGSSECQRINTGTGALNADYLTEDRSGLSMVGDIISITAPDYVADASFQSGIAVDMDGSVENIVYTDRPEFDVYYNKPFAMEFEMKATNLSSNWGILSQYNTASSYGWGVDVTTAGAIQFNVYNSAGTLIARAITDNSFVAASTYYAIRITYAGDNTAPKIYKATTYNGSFTEATYSATTAFTSGQNTSSSRNISFGRYEAVGYFNGRLGYVKFANGSSTFSYSGWKNQAPLCGHQNMGTRLISEKKVGENSATNGVSFDDPGIINANPNSNAMVDSNDLLVKFNHTIAGTAGNAPYFKWIGGRVSTRDITAVEAINLKFGE